MGEEGVVPFGANGIDFVNKNNRWRMILRNPEQLAHQLWAFSEVLLNELRADNPQEGCRCLVGDGLCQQRLAWRQHK